MKRILKLAADFKEAPVDPVKFEQAVFELFVSVPALGLGLFLAVRCVFPS